MNDPGLINASINEYLNITSVIILFIVIGGIVIHIFFRIRTSRPYNKNKEV